MNDILFGNNNMAEPVSNFIGGIACFATMYFTVYRKLSTNIVKK